MGFLMIFRHVVTTSKPTTDIPSQKAAGIPASENRALAPSLNNPYPTDGPFTLYRFTNLPVPGALRPPVTSILPDTIL